MPKHISNLSDESVVKQWMENIYCQYFILPADNSDIFSAVIGGIIFNVANILLFAAIALVGIAVAFPVELAWHWRFI